MGDFAKNVPRAHARQAEVSPLGATKFEPGERLERQELLRRGDFLAEIFRDLNQDVRKTGKDQEVLEVIVSWLLNVSLIPILKVGNRFPGCLGPD